MPKTIDLIADCGCMPGIGVSPAVAEDNRAKIQAALDTASATSDTITAPTGTIIEHTACLRPGHNVRIVGEFTLRLADGQNATQFSVEGPSRYSRRCNVTIEGITLDANAQGQTGLYYPFAAWNFSFLTLRNFTIRDFWSTAANINDLDQEGTGGAWVNPGNGISYQIAALPYGEQTSDHLVMENVKVTRSGANLAFAASNPSMWQGDQFVIGKVYSVRIDGISLGDSGQNGLALQMLQDFRVRGFEGQALARGIFIETCNEGIIEAPHLQIHRMVNNQAGHTADTFGIWFSDASQSYPGANYASCRNIAIVAPRIHNFSRGASTSGRFRSICVSGKTAYPAKNISIIGGIIHDTGQPVGNPKKSYGLSLQGKIVGLRANPLIRDIDGSAVVTAEAYGSNASSLIDVVIT